MRIFAALLPAVLATAVMAQSRFELPGCETPPEIRRVLDEKIGEKIVGPMKGVDQMALERRVLGDLMAKYPRALEPHRRLIQDTRWVDPEAFPALAEHYMKEAERHPGDPLALYLGASVIEGKDTPRSIELLQQAKAKAPEFVWPDLSLAAIHGSGKLADKKRASEEVATFFAACPSTTDGMAGWLLSRSGGPELQARVAAALRRRLAAETDPLVLRRYATLWGLEFRTHPPQEHDAVRKQVAADLKRIEALNTTPDAAWLVFLVGGYKQSGVPAAAVTALEDRILAAYPHSEEAFGIAYDRWKKNHTEPEDQKDTAAWRKYDAEYYAAIRSWAAQFTEERDIQPLTWFNAIFRDPDISQAEGLHALDDFIVEITDYEAPSSWNYTRVASFLLDHGWQPERALEFAEKAHRWLPKQRELGRNDNLTADEIKDRKQEEAQEDQEVEGLILRAAQMSGKLQAGLALKAAVETAPPEDVKLASGYWTNRARLAVLESRKADALTFFQQALFARQQQPQPYHGFLKDELVEEARAVWNGTGGTEVAWKIWKTPPTGRTQELAEGRWEKATKAIPAFELADLTGKTWRLKTLEGKSLLINVWATWCGPCNAELPHLEKLYQKVKDRPDVQIVTLNIDQDLGLVEPFVKEKGFTFPVLPAYSYVLALLDSVAIPQNWIVDPKGGWRWSQLGYDASDATWADTVLGKLQAVKTE